jgi:hypothetical protein
MTESEDELMARLHAVAERAAPASPSGPHLDAAELERVRAFDDDSALDTAYRHLSTCSACRARVTERSESAQPESARPRSTRRAAASSSPAWRRPAWAAAAAIALIGVGYAVGREPPLPEALAVTQRAYAGVMGPDSSTGAPADSTNLELSFVSKAELRAFLLPCSRDGALLAPPRWFEREDSNRFVVVVAPRTFRAHSGEIFGFVVWGAPDSAREAAGRVSERLSRTTSLAATERELRSLANERGARLQKLRLAPR